MLVEELIAGLLEKSVVAGAFIWMLYFILTKQEKSQERQATILEGISDTQAKISMTLIEVCHKMEDISDTIVAMDTRIQKLEERGGA